MKQIVKCISFVLIFTLLCTLVSFADVLPEESGDSGEELLLESDFTEADAEVMINSEDTQINGFAIEAGVREPSEISTLIESKSAWIDYLMQVLNVENYVKWNGYEPKEYLELSGKYDDQFFADHKLAVSYASVPNQQDRLEYVSSTQNGGLVEQAYRIWYSGDEMLSPLERTFLIISEATREAESVEVSYEEAFGVLRKGVMLKNISISTLDYNMDSIIIDSAEQLEKVFGKTKQYDELASQYDDVYFADHELAVSCVYALNEQDELIYFNTVQYGKTVEQKYRYLYSSDEILSPIVKSYVIISEVSPEAEEIVLLKEDLYPVPKKIVINKVPASLVAGKATTVEWAVLPDNAVSKKVTWKSSDSAVAGVNENGVIRGLKAGSATISVCSTFDPKVKNSFKMKILFTDVKNEAAYYYKPVYWALDSGYAEGLSDTAFGPKEICTRSDLIQMLWKMAGAPYSSGRLTYTDTTKLNRSSDEYQAILWGTKNGIVSGYKNGNFGRLGKVTRKQAMLMLYRAAGKPKVRGTLKFKDCNYKKTSDAYKAILWGTKNKITNGKTATTFDPEGICSRGQMITFIYRFAK